MNQHQPTGRLNTTALADAVAAELDISQRAARRTVAAVLGVIARNVAAGHPVAVTNFGTWLPRTLQERGSFNPATGERITAPAKPVVRFRPSPRFVDQLQADDPATVSIRKRPSR